MAKVSCPNCEELTERDGLCPACGVFVDKNGDAVFPPPAQGTVDPTNPDDEGDDNGEGDTQEKKQRPGLPAKGIGLWNPDWWRTRDRTDR